MNETAEKVHELAMDPKILERLVDSIAPSLVGLIKIKAAILYLLLGGVNNYSDGYHVRKPASEYNCMT